MNAETRYFASYIDSLKVLPVTRKERLAEYNKCIRNTPTGDKTRFGADVKFEEFSELVSLKRKTGSLVMLL